MKKRSARSLSFIPVVVVVVVGIGCPRGNVPRWCVSTTLTDVWMCMRAAAFHARHPPAIMRMVKPRDEGEKEIAKARGGRGERARRPRGYTWKRPRRLFVNGWETATDLAHGLSLSLSLPFCLSISLWPYGAEKKRWKGGGEIGRRREDSPLFSARQAERTGHVLLDVDRGYKSSR